MNQPDVQQDREDAYVVRGIPCACDVDSRCENIDYGSEIGKCRARILAPTVMTAFTRAGDEVSARE
jgi:hypothetical protein